MLGIKQAASRSNLSEGIGVHQLFVNIIYIRPSTAELQVEGFILEFIK